MGIGIIKDYYVMKTLQEGMRSLSKGYSIVIVTIVISVVSITTTPSIMTEEKQHTAFAQLSGQESLGSNVGQNPIHEFSVPSGSRPHDVAPMPNGTLV